MDKGYDLGIITAIGLWHQNKIQEDNIFLALDNKSK